MKVILTATGGPHAGLTFEVLERKTIRLGRAESADYSFPNDTFMSSLHVLIDRTKAEVRLGDLGSRNGTSVNGERIVTAVLKDGDQLQFGQTTLEVFTSTSPNPASAVPDKLSLHELAKSALGCLYVLLDGAQGPQVRELLRSATAPYESLYDGDLKTRLEDVAPYLLEISKDLELTKELTSKAWWGKNLSVYLFSRLPFDGVRAHLRRFLFVKNEAGEQLYFRFYDPRVLAAYLDTCTPEERGMFLGPISQFWVETGERPMVKHL